MSLKLIISVGVLGLFAVLYYNAYVVNQPCRHTLTPLDESEKIPLSQQVLGRISKALSIRTISSFENQNKSAVVEFAKLIRKGTLPSGKVSINR